MNAQAVSAVELFVAVGSNAVAGFPNAQGLLIVAASGLGAVLVSTQDWKEYRALCAFHTSLFGVAV